jgi:Flp pilus assembly protein TadD
MGLQDFFRKLFAAEPVRVDYRGVTTERLLELWAQRHQLTEAAVVELQAEAARRSVELPQPRPRPAPKPALPPRQPITGQHVWVLPPAAVVLRTEGAGAVLCLLPTTEPGLGWLDSLAKDRSVEVEAVVAFNAAPGGHLPTSLAAGALKVRPEAVFLLDASQPGDRPHAAWPSTTPLSGVRLPKRLDRGFLRLGVLTGRPNALVASWNDGDELRALIGADVRCADVATRSASHVIGGLVPELGADALDALLELDEVVFLQGVPGVQPWPEPLTAMGIDATVVRTTRDAAPADGAMERVARALASTDDTALGEVVGALTDTELETVTTALLLGREGHAEAERVTRLSCERHPESASAWFQRGVVAFVRGAHAEAVDAYLRATRATAPEPRAWVNLAAMHGRQAEWAEALRYAEAAHQAMPGDELALHHRLGALLGLGRVGDARALLEDLLGPGRRPNGVACAARVGLRAATGPRLLPAPGARGPAGRRRAARRGAAAGRRGAHARPRVRPPARRAPARARQPAGDSGP